MAIMAMLGTHLASAASYNEFVNGDLSTNAMSPTTLALDPGPNELAAETSSADYDLLRIIVPAGQTLDSIVLDFHEGVNQVFTGLQNSPTWTAGIGNDIDPAMLLGWTDFPVDPSGSHTDEDILDDIGLAKFPEGFTPPLPSGNYTFLFQAPSSTIPFALTFNVSGAAPPGDFNGDMKVDAADLAMWRVAYGVSATADADGDEDSDGVDFLLWQKNLQVNPTVAAGAAAPEPGAGIFVCAVLAALGSLRRRLVTL